MKHKLVSAYNTAIFDTDKLEVYQVIDKALASGMLPEEIIFEIIIPAIDSMMPNISESKEVNLAQHFFASKMASEITDKMVSQFKTSPQIIGNVVIGTSTGDFHGLGKRIVCGCLNAHFIKTIDLGLNISAEKFVDEAIANNANVIAISSMMLHTATGENGCIKVREILKEKKLEDTIKLIVGGAPYRFDAQLYAAVKADAWAENGNLAGLVVTDLLKEVKKW